MRQNTHMRHPVCRQPLMMHTKRLGGGIHQLCINRGARTVHPHPKAPDDSRPPGVSP
jgi:hypothetical protein